MTEDLIRKRQILAIEKCFLKEVEFVNEVLTSAGTFIKQTTSGRKAPLCRVGWRVAVSKAVEAEILLQTRC